MRIIISPWEAAPTLVRGGGLLVVRRAELMI